MALIFFASLATWISHDVKKRVTKDDVYSKLSNLNKQSYNDLKAEQDKQKVDILKFKEWINWSTLQEEFSKLNNDIEVHNHNVLVLQANYFARIHTAVGKLATSDDSYHDDLVVNRMLMALTVISGVSWVKKLFRRY